MKSTSRSSRFVRIAARSPALGNHRPRRCAESDTQFFGHDLAERRFAKARRASKQHVIQSIAPRARRLNEHLQVLARLRLAGEVIQRLWPDLRVKLVGLALGGGDHAISVGVLHVCHRPTAPGLARVEPYAASHASPKRSRNTVATIPAKPVATFLSDGCA